jgi:hypothetical protein
LKKSKYKSLGDVKDALTKYVGAPSGVVERIFSKDGKEILQLDEIVHQGRYICTGKESFDEKQGSNVMSTLLTN